MYKTNIAKMFLNQVTRFEQMFLGHIMLLAKQSMMQSSSMTVGIAFPTISVYLCQTNLKTNHVHYFLLVHPVTLITIYSNILWRYTGADLYL